MMSGRRRRPLPVRSRSSAGFTLIELVIALVISGIVASVVFEMILGQNRFARYQGAREEVQQNARAAIELVASELRGLPPAAILQAEANRIRFALPRAWGVLCTPVTDATGTIWVRFPAGVFPAEFTNNASWGLAVGQPEPNGPPADPPPDPPVPANVEDIPQLWRLRTEVDSPGGAHTCSDAGSLQAPVPAAQVEHRAFSGGGFFHPDRHVANTIPVGTPVFVYQVVEYDMNTSSIPGLWIRRNTQPMAGPVPATAGADAGLQLTYQNAAGNPIANPVANDTMIARVGIRVITNSRAKFNGRSQLENASTGVYLRNRN